VEGATGKGSINSYKARTDQTELSDLPYPDKFNLYCYLSICCWPDPHTKGKPKKNWERRSVPRETAGVTAGENAK
jgi:hypothetical protein